LHYSRKKSKQTSFGVAMKRALKFEEKLSDSNGVLVKNCWQEKVD